MEGCPLNPNDLFANAGNMLYIPIDKKEGTNYTDKTGVLVW